MDEKKSVKISLSTFFLVLAIIVIIIMGYFIYKLNNEKTVETEKVANLNNEVSSLQGTVNQLQGKIDNISNTINSNTSTNNTLPEQSNNTVAEDKTTSTKNSISSNKEIYKLVRTKDLDISDLEDYDEKYIVLDGNSIYFSTDLSDKIYEGTYKVDSKNNIDYKTLNETQDYAFYTASIFRFETINGKKNIVIDNDPNGMMYFEKVD